MYRLTVDGDETYMIVTRNVFSHRLSVFKKYDLKVWGQGITFLLFKSEIHTAYENRNMEQQLSSVEDEIPQAKQYLSYLIQFS